MRALSSIALVTAALAAGCASDPPAPPPAAPAPEPLVCPPVAAPACPASPATTPKPPVETRGKLVASTWAAIPEWKREPLRPALEAFARGCPVLEKQDTWKGVCAGAATLGGAAESDIAAFFELNFDPYQVLNADDSTAGMVTGYYEPLLRGSRTRSERFRYPLYAAPPDLLVVDLSALPIGRAHV